MRLRRIRPSDDGLCAPHIRRREWRSLTSHEIIYYNIIIVLYFVTYISIIPNGIKVTIPGDAGVLSARELNLRE